MIAQYRAGVRDRQVSRNTAGTLSPARRVTDLRRLAEEEFDVLVIGGGVTGAGAALDAASRGLSVALIEANDLASGTSSRSSKLVHGGLRYLEQLEFHLVHEALRERGLLATRLAPHLVRPVPFLVPLPGDAAWKRAWNRVYYGAGVALYDAFAAGLQGASGRGMPLHRHLTQRGAHQLFPSLRPEAAVGAIRYFDGQVDDARLVISLARTAASLGAAVVTRVRATGLTRQAREITGVRATDETGREFAIRARTVVAATGVWSDDITALLPDARPGLRVRASKGIHLVVPRSAITGDVGLILRTASSVLFVIPWGGHWLIGTTDTDWMLDREHPAASARDIDYLLSEVNKVLDRPIGRDDIEGVYAGLRPLLSGEEDSTSALSREHAVVEPMLGLFLVAGGKLTTYRVMASDVVDHVVRRLRSLDPASWAEGRKRPGRGGLESATDDLPLLGADGYQAMWRRRAELARRAKSRLTVGAVEHLLERYGTLTVDLLHLIDSAVDLGDPLEGAPEYLAVEVAYAAGAEGALHLDDVLTRRTRISIETEHRGVETAPHAARIMAGVLGWDEATTRAEVEAYERRVDAERRSQTMPDDASADAARTRS
ncbi:glycerol-3-phosphate dehydrogenase/oxidase [Hamadaea sp. NPDC051192]|uniref:glycerol-3-phosphate dehydrogenase/oxidase n=1 Tax=Hamadaea sp. NPDC051192 TaxID=3154940 RepID=UPI0034328681